MAAQTKYWQPDFDPAATYVVAAWPAGFTVRGREPKRGEIFDNNSVPMNMLRSHYESRWITMAEPRELILPPPQPEPPELLSRPKKKQANSRTLV